MRVTVVVGLELIHRNSLQERRIGAPATAGFLEGRADGRGAPWRSRELTDIAFQIAARLSGPLWRAGGCLLIRRGSPG